VVNLKPFRVEECSAGSGDTCGALYLDQGFEKLLRRKLGVHADSILTDRPIGELLRYFDNNIKRTFNPLGPRCAAEYEIGIAGVMNIPDIGLEDGYLTLTRYHSLSITLNFEGMISRVSSIRSSRKL
jgi:hypothetical protein